MKRLLLVTFLLSCSLLGSFNAIAQKKRAAFLTMGPTFGLKAGIGITNLAGTDIARPIGPGRGLNMVTTLSSKIGIVGGAMFNYRFTPLLSFQAEALFSGRGFIAKSVNKLTSDRRNYNVSLQYAEIPLLLKVNAKIFYLEGGVVPSVLVASTFDEELKPATGSSSTKEAQDLPGINSFEVCWAIGGGVELNEGFVLGLRYVRGSSSVGAKTGGGASNVNLTDRSLVNTSTQITAGYIFNHSYGRGRRRH